MRKAVLTNSFNKGVLDPRISERNDLAHTYQSIVDGENCLFTPQGGVLDRGGTALISDADVLAAGIPRRLRRRLEPVPLTAANFTAINGGNAGFLTDGASATKLVTNAVAATPFTVVDIDLGQDTRVDAIDLVDISVALVGINQTLTVEYYAGFQWHLFGGSFDNANYKHLRTTPRTRRFAGWPGQSAAARYWRVTLNGAAGAGAVTLGRVRMWTETEVLSPVQLMSVSRSITESYELVLTDRNIDVFKQQRYQASIAVPVAAHQVAQIWDEASLDTLLLFHEDIETIEIVRQGSDGEWDVRPKVWSNVPALKTTTAFSGSQDEIQEIHLGAIGAGAQVVLALGDLWTAPIIYVTPAQFVIDAASALGMLENVAAGNIAIYQTGPSSFKFLFVDANGSRAWPALTPVVLGAVVAPPDPVVLQRGLDVASDLFGPRTGWPRCGAFVQSRLLIGGLRAAPTSYALSRVGKFFDFQTATSPLTADLAFVRALDVAEVETIRAVYVGRHIQIFTDSGEWYLEARTLDATQAQNAVLATRHGSEPTVPPLFVEGATLFMQKGGQTLRDFLFANVEQSYTADPVTVLAPHLLTGVVDMAHRTSRSVREGNLILMINADGTAVMLTLLKSQGVVAMAPWATPHGALRRTIVDINHTLLLAVERDGQHYLERWVPTLPLDAATTVTGTALTSVAHLPFPDGREVWAYCDDDLIGPLTVMAGSVTLPAPVSTAIVGLAPAWRARLPVIRGKPGEERPFRPPCRIYAVDVALDNTGDISIAVNGGHHNAVPLTRSDGSFARGGPLQTEHGGAPHLPMLQRLYTGQRCVEGLTGWTQFPFVELSRLVPAPVHVKSVRMEVAYNG